MKNFFYAVIILSFLSNCSGYNTSTKIKNEYQIPEHEENWVNFFEYKKGLLSSTMSDIGIKKIAPIKNMQYLGTVELKMNNPTEDGLSSSNEVQKLNSIEDKFVIKSVENSNTIYTGSLTYNNFRFFYFYLSDTLLFEEQITFVMEKFKDYEYNIKIEQDVNWDYYLNSLYPSDEQFEAIMNANVIFKLSEINGVLYNKQKILHYIFFNNQVDRNEYSKIVQLESYNVENEWKDDKTNNYNYILCISRIDSIAPFYIDSLTIPLWKLANEYNAKYDGWEVEINR